MAHDSAPLPPDVFLIQKGNEIQLIQKNASLRPPRRPHTAALVVLRFALS